MAEPFLQFGNHQVRVTVEDFEVADSVPAEEWTGYRPVEPKTGLINAAITPPQSPRPPTHFHMSPGEGVRCESKGRDVETYHLSRIHQYQTMSGRRP